MNQRFTLNVNGQAHILAGLSTCARAVEPVFSQSAKCHTVRAIGLLLALGCAVVFDGRMQVWAQGWGGWTPGGWIGWTSRRTTRCLLDSRIQLRTPRA